MSGRKPRAMALAFRIWAYATPRGWDVTSVELAEELGAPVPAIIATLRWRGWNTRVRKTSIRYEYGPNALTAEVSDFEALCDTHEQLQKIG